jgi:tRNA threonylcarbamoyladenosine biosynthesis protein TsaE
VSSGNAPREEALPTRKATIRLARRIAPELVPGMLLLLDGPLGAGKTFFARALLRALGVDEDVAVPSPTFGLVHRYEAKGRVLIHADLYRIRDEADPARATGALGLREDREDGAILLVEWAAGLEDPLGGPADVTVEFRRCGEARHAIVSNLAR